MEHYFSCVKNNIPSLAFFCANKVTLDLYSKSREQERRTYNSQTRAAQCSFNNPRSWLPTPTIFTAMHFTEQRFIGLPGIINTSKFTEHLPHLPHLPVSEYHRDMSSLDQWEASPGLASCTNHRPPLLSADSGLVVSLSLLMTQFKFDHPRTRGQRTRVHSPKRRLCLLH